MAVRGRKPKPDALKILQGNPGKRKLDKKKPKPLAAGLEAPDWMKAEAKAEWNRIVPELQRTCGLAAIDRAMVATYCQLWARFVEGEKTNKPVKAAHIAQMRAAMSSLGLEPSSRTRLGSGDNGPENDFDNLDNFEDVPVSGLSAAIPKGRA